MVKGFLSRLSELFLFTGYSGLKILIRSLNCLVTSLWGTPSWKGLQNQNEMMPQYYSDICILAISIKNLSSSVSFVRLIKTKPQCFMLCYYEEFIVEQTLLWQSVLFQISLHFLFLHFKVLKLHFSLVDFGFRVL